MIEDSELPDPLTPGEAARQMRLDEKTVIAWCNSGRLPAEQLGGKHGPWRIRRDDWVAFRRKNKVAVKAGRREQRKGKIPGPSRQRAADRVLDAAGIGA